MRRQRSPRHAPRQGQTPSPQVESDEQSTIGNAAVQERVRARPPAPEPSPLAEEDEEYQVDQRRVYGVDEAESPEFRSTRRTAEIEVEDGETSGNVGLSRRRDGIGDQRDTGGNVGLNGEGRFTGALNTRRTVRDATVDEDERSSEAHEHGVEWTGDALRASREREEVVHDENGRRARSSTTTATLTGDHRGVAHQGYRERDGENGDRVRTTYEGSADLDEGRFTLGGGRQLRRRNSDGEHEEARGVSGTGTVDVDRRGRLEGLEGEGEVRWGPVTLSASGEWSVRAGQPRRIEREDGTVVWAVDWSRVRAGGGGFGASGSRGGGELEIRRRNEERGVERFATREAAQAFADDIRNRIDRLAAGPGDGDAALRMQEGESVSQQQTSSNTLGGNGSTGYLGLGARGGVEESEGRTIARGRAPDGRDYVDVTVDTARMEHLGISGSGPGVSMGHRGERRHAEQRVVRFFVGTPEGRAAFEAFQADRPLPEGGWTLRGQTTTDSESDETTLGLADVDVPGIGPVGFAGTDASEHEVIERVDEEGRASTEYRGENTRGARALGDRYSESNQMSATFREDGRRSYTVQTRASGTDASDVQDALGTATNTSHGGAEGPAEGRYTVQSRASTAQMDRFVRRVRNREANLMVLPGGIGGVGNSGEELRDELLALPAGDREGQARVVTDWISEGGPAAMAFFREESGVGMGADQTDVRLEGDRFLRGSEQRQGLERRIARYRAALDRPGTDRGQVGRSIAGDLNGVRARLAALGDNARYRSLPQEIRDEELSRTRGWIEQLEALQRSAEQPGPAAAEGAQEEGEGDAPARAQPSRGSGVLAQMDALQQRANRARERAEGLDRQTTLSRDVHAGRHLGMGETQSARDAFGGQRNLENLWGVFGRDHASDYQTADAAFAEGQRLMRAGRQTRRDSERLRAQLAHAETEDAARHLAPQLRVMLETEVSTFTAAAEQLRRAESTFQRIRRQHADRPGMWAGYSAAE